MPNIAELLIGVKPPTGVVRLSALALLVCLGGHWSPLLSDIMSSVRLCPLNVLHFSSIIFVLLLM